MNNWYFRHRHEAGEESNASIPLATCLFVSFCFVMAVIPYWAIIIYLCTHTQRPYWTWIVQHSLLFDYPTYFSPSSFSSYLAIVKCQWLTVAIIFVISKGQIVSPHTLLQHHITLWNSPRGTFTVVIKRRRNLGVTFQFIHAITFPHHFWERGGVFAQLL